LSWVRLHGAGGMEKTSSATHRDQILHVWQTVSIRQKGA
jgi:hypothetical protein